MTKFHELPEQPVYFKNILLIQLFTLIMSFIRATALKETTKSLFQYVMVCILLLNQVQFQTFIRHHNKQCSINGC